MKCWTLSCAHRMTDLGAIDITPTAVTAAASKRLLEQFVTELSAAGIDLADVKSRRLRTAKPLARKRRKAEDEG